MTKQPSPNPKVNPTRWWILGVGVGIILLIVGIVLFTRDKDTTPTTNTLDKVVSPEKAKSMQSEGAFILDVREPDEWDQGHIPSAHLIPLSELKNRLAELPKDQEIVVVCSSGNRSATGRDILLENGFEHVTSMAGGIIAWQAQGFTIE